MLGHVGTRWCSGAENFLPHSVALSLADDSAAARWNIRYSVRFSAGLQPELLVKCVCVLLTRQPASWRQPHFSLSESTFLVCCQWVVEHEKRFVVAACCELCLLLVCNELNWVQAVKLLKHIRGDVLVPDGRCEDCSVLLAKRRLWGFMTCGQILTQHTKKSASLWWAFTGLNNPTVWDNRRNVGKTLCFIWTWDLSSIKSECKMHQLLIKVWKFVSSIFK